MNSESKNIDHKLKEAQETPELKVTDSEESKLTKVTSSDEIQNSEKAPIVKAESREDKKVTHLPEVWPGIFFAMVSIVIFYMIGESSGFPAMLVFSYFSLSFISIVWWCHCLVSQHKVIKESMPEAPVVDVSSVVRTKVIQILISMYIILIPLSPFVFHQHINYTHGALLLLPAYYFMFKEWEWSWKLAKFMFSLQPEAMKGMRIFETAYLVTISLANLLGTLFWPWYAFLLVATNNFWISKVLTKRSSDGSFTERDIVSTRDKTILRYRKYAAIEKWVKHRFTSSKTSLLKSIIMAVLAPILVFLGFAGSYQLIAWIANIAQQAAGAGASGELNSSNLAVIQWFLVTLFGGISLSTIMYTKAATHLELTASGITYLRKKGHGVEKQKSIPWSQIESITLEESSAGSNSALLFNRKAGKKPVKVNLSSIPSIEERQDLLDAIEKFAPSIPRTSEAIFALQLPPEHSYTELWLQALAAPPKREKLQPLEAGALVKEGRYQIEGKLGVGGQGFAYLAKDTATMKTVVLKEFILPVFVDMDVRKSALKQFESEAKILSQLDHPQIVKLEDFMVEDHRAYLVLEHIDGKSLREIVKENGPLDEAQIKDLAKQMCTVLDHLHSKEPAVVHRDFTPDNLILGKDGTLKLIDFNVAQQSDATTIAKVVGKQAYLPPEQFQGKPTTQSDIYAMGCTIHFLLTGKDPVPISQSRPKEQNEAISASINKVVSKATSIKLEDRYASSKEILADIDSQTDETPEPEPVSKTVKKEVEDIEPIKQAPETVAANSIKDDHKKVEEIENIQTTIDSGEPTIDGRSQSVPAAENPVPYIDLLPSNIHKKKNGLILALLDWAAIASILFVVVRSKHFESEAILISTFIFALLILIFLLPKLSKYHQNAYLDSIEKLEENKKDNR